MKKAWKSFEYLIFHAFYVTMLIVMEKTSKNGGETKQKA